MGASLSNTSSEDADIRFMKRAIDLARKGAGVVAPNPMVGSVIVDENGAVVGEGWHKGPGESHAEIEALAAAGDAARGATVYVSLEPCNHQGRTGPCAEALIKAGVGEVAYAMSDPNPTAAGGAARLRDAGVKVCGGVCEAEARELNRFWLHWLKTQRPYVIAKFAASLDGKIATHCGDSQWITGPASRKRAHELRAQIDGIIVGANTVTADDPSLTARLSDSDTRRPLRIVLDTAAGTSPGSKAYDRAGDGALLAVTENAPQARLAAFREHGVDILTLPKGGDGRPDPDALLSALGAKGLNAVMIEGGGKTLGAFFDADLVDEVWAFIAPVIIGGPGKTAVAGAGAASLEDAFRLSEVAVETLSPDILMRGRVNREGAR